MGAVERGVVGKPNSWQEMLCTVGFFHQDTYNLETATNPCWMDFEVFKL